MESFRQHGDSERAKTIPFAIKDCLALNNHLGILQTSLSSKPYTLLSRNLMGGSRQIGYTEADTIPLGCLREHSIKLPS